MSSTQKPRSRARSIAGRRRVDRFFVWFCIATASISVLILFQILTSIFLQGYPLLSWRFLWVASGPDPETAGVGPALFGTILVCALCALVVLPLGLASAIWLDEFRRRHR